MFKINQDKITSTNGFKSVTVKLEAIERLTNFHVLFSQAYRVNDSYYDNFDIIITINITL